MVRRVPARGMIAITMGIIAFLVMAGTGVASAAWFASATTSGSVSAATVSFTAVGSGAGLGTEYKFTGAAPGGAVVRPIVLTNTGQSPINYSLTMANTGSATLSANVTLILWLMTGTCTTNPGTGNTVGTLAAPPAMPTGLTSAAAGGSAATLCMLTRLNTTVAASQGQTVTSTPTFTGKVGTSAWTATAVDAAFTQTVYRVGNVTNATCTTTAPIVLGLVNGYATFTWTTTAGVTYKIVDSGNSGVIPSSGTPPVRVDAAQLSSTSTTLTIYAMESTYGTTSTGVPFAMTSVYGVLGLVVASVTCPTP